MTPMQSAAGLSGTCGGAGHERSAVLPNAAAITSTLTSKTAELSRFREVLHGFFVRGDAFGGEVAGVALLQLLELLRDGDRLHDPQRLTKVLGAVAIAETGHEPVKQRPVLVGDGEADGRGHESRLRPALRASLIRRRAVS